MRFVNVKKNKNSEAKQNEKKNEELKKGDILDIREDIGEGGKKR